MKTLKKTLCLVLAMVMVFGLCAISASANLGYADTDDITYKEAVDVMSGIGILSGDARGFRPTDKITRAEAAKIIAYIVIGNAAQADALKASTAPFVDVPASHWAAGYIQYCAASGIILGKADGYHPNDPVTGLEFATMLLRALGYGKNGEFVGSDWSINAAREGLRLGVFYKNTAGATTEPATREQCALYAFNVINGANDQYTGINKVTYSQLLGGYVSTTGTLLGDAADANKLGTFGADFNLKKMTKSDSAFKLDDGHYWIINDNKRTVISGNYDDDANLQKVYTTKVKGGDIYDLLGSDAKDLKISASAPSAGADDTDTLKVYVDGVRKYKTTGQVVDPATKFIKGNDDEIFETVTTGPGIETYVYAWYVNGVLNAKICVVNTYLAKVDKVVAGKNGGDPTTTVTALTGPTGAASISAKTYPTDEFEKGDYVLVTYANSKIQSMEAAIVVEGIVSRFIQDGSKRSIVSGGETYVAAQNAAGNSDLTSAASISKALVNGKDHKLYLDKNNYLIATSAVAEDSNYVYVSHFDIKTDISGDFDATSLGAKVYFADGTSDIVTVKQVNTSEIGKNSVTAASLKSSPAGLYKLTWDGSKAILTNTDAGNLAEKSAAADSKVKKGLSSTIDDTVKADNKTVFFYVKWDKTANSNAGGYYGWNSKDFAVTVYTGINSVPANSDGTKAEADKILWKGTGTDAAYAVLVKDKDEGDAKDTVYLFTKDYNVEQVGDKYVATYKTYVDGEETDLEITYSDRTKAVDPVSYAGKFGTVSTDGTISVYSDAAVTTVSKVKYCNGAKLAAFTDDYEINLTSTALTADTNTKFAADSTKIIDLSGNDLTSVSAIKDYIAVTGNALASKDYNVAIQYGEDGTNYLYIGSITTIGG